MSVRAGAAGNVFGTRIGQRPFSAALARSSAKLAGAQNALPPPPTERLLPHFPSLKTYTPAQIKTITGAYQQAMGKYHSQYAPDAKNALDATTRFYNHASPATQRLIDDVYTRAFDQQSANHNAGLQQQGLGNTSTPPSNAARAQTHAQPAPPGLATPGGPLGAIASAVTSPAHNLALAVGPHVGKFFLNAAKDVVDTPLNIGETLGTVGQLAWGLANPDTRAGAEAQGHQMVQNYLQSDAIPLFLQGKFKQGAHAFYNHPANTAMELAGAYSAVGRGVGLLARAGALGEGATADARFLARPGAYPHGNGPTEGTPSHVVHHQNVEEGLPARGHQIIAQHGGDVRAALRAVHPDHGGNARDLRDVQAARSGSEPPVRAQRVPGEPGTPGGQAYPQRPYSRNYFTMKAQRALQARREAANVKAGRHPQAVNPIPSRFHPVSAHPVTGTKANSMMLRRTDEEVATTNSMIRSGRDQSVADFRSLNDPGRLARLRGTPSIPPEQRDAEALIAIRAIRNPATVRQDLENYLARTASPEGSRMYGSQERLRQENLAAARRLLNDKQFIANPGPVYTVAERAVGMLNDFERQRVGQPGGLREEHIAAKYKPYGIYHMFGRAPERGETVQSESYQEYQDALAHEQAAQQEVTNAQSAAVAARQAEQRNPSELTRQATQAAEQRIQKAEEVAALQTRVREMLAGSEPKRDPFLVDERTGREITLEHVKAHMDANNVPEPAFISQRDREFTPGSAYWRGMVDRKGNYPRSVFKHRTGAATEQASFSIKPDSIEQQLAEHATNVEAIKGFHRIFEAGGGLRLKGEPASNWDEALHVADELTNGKDGHGGTKIPYSVVRIGPLREFDQAAARHPVDDHFGSYSQRLQEAFDRPPQGSGDELALMPTVMKERLLEHYARQNAGLRAFQRVVAGPWARNILGTSFKRPVTEMVDMSLRQLAYGNGPLSNVVGHKLLESLAKQGPKGAEARRLLEARMPVGVAHGVQQAQTFGEQSNLWQQISKLPPVRIPVALVRFHINNMLRATAWLEKQQAIAALGSVARKQIKTEMGSLKTAWGYSPKAIEDFAKGLTGTEPQVKLAQGVAEILGRWNARSPAWRALGSFAPFLQWVRVALKFSYYTLPVHHPIKTALAAALSNATQQQREALGLYDPLQVDLNAPHLKEYQQGGIELGGRVFPLQRYTSFGASDPFISLDEVMPQFSSAFLARQGVDWKGSQLKNKDGSYPGLGERMAIILSTFGEGLIPETPLIHRALDQGGTPSAEDAYSWILGHPSVQGKKGIAAAIENIILPELKSQKPAFDKKAGGGGVDVTPGHPGAAPSGGGGGSLQFNFGGGGSSAPPSGGSAPAGGTGGDLQFSFPQGGG